MNDTKVREQVLEAIEKKGLKKRWVAIEIGVSPGHLTGFLTGRNDLGLAAKKSLLRLLNIEATDIKAS